MIRNVSGVQKLIRQFEQKSGHSDKIPNEIAAKGSAQDRKVISTDSDSSTADKKAMCDRKVKVTPVESCKNHSDKPPTATLIDDKKLMATDTAVKFAPNRHQSDNPKSFNHDTDKESTANIDKEITPDKLISDRPVSGRNIFDVPRRTISTNEMDLVSKSSDADKANTDSRDVDKEVFVDKVRTVDSVSDSGFRKSRLSTSDMEALNTKYRSISDKCRIDKQTWNKPIEKAKEQFHPALIRLRSDNGTTDKPTLLPGAVVTDNTALIGDTVVLPGNGTTDKAATPRLFSDGDTHIKPARTDSAKAKRPDVLLLPPLSPSDTDEDTRTPRPLSGSFRSPDLTAVFESSLVELPLKFRQYLDDRPLSVPELTRPGTCRTLKSEHENKNSGQGHERQETGDAPVTTNDAHATKRVVNYDKSREDDIRIALDWIQQELRQMKGKDRTLIRQLLDTGASIHHLRGMTDCRSFNPDESASSGGDRTPDWSSPVQSSMSADFCIILVDPVSGPSAVKRQATERMVSRRSLETVNSSARLVDPKESYV